MSEYTFYIEKYLLEKEIRSYSKFLDTNLKDHPVEYPDTTEMAAYIGKIKSRINEDIGKTGEEFFKTIVVPSWKCMFDVDNIIDTGKTLKEQEEIIQSFLDSLEKTGLINDTYVPKDTCEKINKDFLESKYKFCILKEILKSELALCNSNIDWKTATFERVRIMFYSGLFVGDVDKVEDLIETLNTKNPKKIESIFPTSMIGLMKSLVTPGTYDDRFSILDPSTFANIFPEEVVNIIRKFSITSIYEETFTLFDLIHFLVFISVGCGVSDDYMDLEEDTQNNKITGVTQAIKQDINVQHIMSSTLAYLKLSNEIPTYSINSKEWFCKLMALLYHDKEKCLGFFKDLSPYLYNIICQRKS
jgi:hypothetical protein